MKADVYWAERVEANLIRKKVVCPTFKGKKLCINKYENKFRFSINRDLFVQIRRNKGNALLKNLER